MGNFRVLDALTTLAFDYPARTNPNAPPCSEASSGIS